MKHDRAPDIVNEENSLKYVLIGDEFPIVNAYQIFLFRTKSKIYFFINCT